MEESEEELPNYREQITKPSLRKKARRCIDPLKERTSKSTLNKKKKVLPVSWLRNRTTLIFIEIL